MSKWKDAEGVTVETGLSGYETIEIDAKKLVPDFVRTRDVASLLRALADELEAQPPLGRVAVVEFDRVERRFREAHMTMRVRGLK